MCDDECLISGNGDILSFEDANLRRQNTNVAGLMIARLFLFCFIYCFFVCFAYI